METSRCRSVLLTNVFGLSALTEQFEQNISKLTWPHSWCVLSSWIPSSTLNDNSTEQGNNSGRFSFLMLRLVSNQAISSIDGSVSLASCLFVSADKGNAIRGRWTLLTLAILWLLCDIDTSVIIVSGTLIANKCLLFWCLLSYFFSHSCIHLILKVTQIETITMHWHDAVTKSNSHELLCWQVNLKEAESQHISWSEWQPFSTWI